MRWLEPGRRYLVRGVFGRSTNPVDPAGDAVELRCAWLNRFAAGITSDVLVQRIDLVTGLGMISVSAIISAGSGDDVDVVAPAGTVYFRPFVQTYGSLCVTDIESIHVVDVTGQTLYSPDLSEVEGLLTLNIGSRLDSVESALDGRKVERYPTRSDAVAATPAATTEVVEVMGWANAGDGGAGSYVFSNSEPSHGASFQTTDGSWWVLAEKDNLRVEQFGAFASVGDNGPMLEAASTYMKSIGQTRLIVDGDLAVSAADMTDLADVTFIGEGSVTGVLRKRVIPPNAASDYPLSQTLTPDTHLRRMNSIKNPVVVLVGDSIATHYANTLARQNNVVEVLREHLSNQFSDRSVTLHDRGINGSAFPYFFGIPPNAAEVSWYTDTGATWDTYIEALQPDVIVFHFGMNDSSGVMLSAINNIIFTIRTTWSKVPDFIFCTNLVPALSYLGGDEAEQIGRDQAAGMVRSYAQSFGHGYLDFHRRQCIIRDGFDPCESAIKEGADVAVSEVPGYYVGSTKCTDWRIKIQFTAPTFTGSDSFIFSTGPGTNDWLVIGVSAGNYTFATYGGENGVGNFVEIDTHAANPAEAVPGSGTETLVIEKYLNRITVYRDTNNFGTYTPPIWSGKLVAKGGEYLPAVLCNGVTMVGVRVDYGEARRYMPSITDSALWGVGGDYGGSGYNHPSDLAASHIYGPVVRASQWRGRQGAGFRAHKNGTDQSSVPSAVATLVTFNADTFGRGYFDPSTSRYTPPPGTYRLDAVVTLSAGVVDAAIVQLIIRKNGSAGGGGASTSVANTTALQSFSVSAIVESDGTDYFDLTVYAGGAGDKTVHGDPATTVFSGDRIG